PKDETILYLGTDNGAYVTFNNGASWDAFSNGLPSVAVHDLVVQPDMNDLVLGTHGRSIYIANIAVLQEWNNSKSNKAITIMAVDKIRHSGRWGNAFSSWSKPFEPSTKFTFYAQNSGHQIIKILSEKGAVLNEIKMDADKGFNYVNYDLSLTENGRKALVKENAELQINKAKNDKYYLPKGNYYIQIGDEKKPFKVE